MCTRGSFGQDAGKRKDALGLGSRTRKEGEGNILYMLGKKWENPIENSRFLIYIVVTIKDLIWGHF